MASKRKVNLNDYELTTTLGTGKWSEAIGRSLIGWEYTSGLTDHTIKAEFSDFPPNSMRQSIAAIFE